MHHLVFKKEMATLFLLHKYWLQQNVQLGMHRNRSVLRGLGTTDNQIKEKYNRKYGLWRSLLHWGFSQAFVCTMLTFTVAVTMLVFLSFSTKNTLFYLRAFVCNVGFCPSRLFWPKYLLIFLQISAQWSLPPYMPFLISLSRSIAKCQSLHSARLRTAGIGKCSVVPRGTFASP